MSSDTYLPDKMLSFGLVFFGCFGDAAGFVLPKTSTGHVTRRHFLGLRPSNASELKVGLLYGLWGRFVVGVGNGRAAMIFLRQARRNLGSCALYCWGLIVRNLTAPLQADPAS